MLPSRGALRTLRVVATGYTAGCESTGKNPGDPGYGITKSGLPAAPGACATDPDVIPLGSVLYVPGYGYAVALDTGDDIKGNRIDLFFQDKQQALVWGRRAVEVAVIR
ncbi:MAG: 3D domain-containing protein [Bacillota bacterium]